MANESVEGMTVPDVATDADNEAVEAFDKGLSEAGLEMVEEERSEAEPTEEEPAQAEPTEEEAAEVEPTEEEPESSEDEPEDEPEEETDEEPEEGDPDAVDEEIESLGLKEKAAERFRELSKRLPVEETEALKKRAEEAQAFREVFTDTFQTPERFQEVAAVVKGMNSADPALKAQARAALAEALANLDKELGYKTDGYDPLAEHPDLSKRVALEEYEEGHLSRADAEEIARLRKTSALNENWREQQQQQSLQAQQAEQAKAQSIAQIRQLDEYLKANDPDYVAKYEALGPTLDLIKTRLPPAQWPEAIAEAWQRTQVKPSKPKPGHVPLRSTRSGAMRREPKTDIEAFEMGADNPEEFL